jgi:hypothetical protein
MPNPRVFTRSFGGGEISPEMFGRIDDNKYQIGAATLLNMITKPEGHVMNRPGTKFVRQTKATGGLSTRKSRLIPFTFSTTQTVVIELGAEDANTSGYIRFYSLGQPLLVPTGGSAPATYIGPRTSTAVNSTTDIVSFTVNPFVDGDAITLTQGTANPLPTPLKTGTVYYVKSVSSTDIKICATKADALAGTGIDFGASGANDIRAHYVYTAGDLVTFSGSVYVCLQDYPEENAPAVVASTYWYAQPATGEYELPSPYKEEDLFSINYVQSNDVLTLAHQKYPVAEIRRYGAIKWDYKPVTFAASLSAPINVTAQRTLGVGSQITLINNAASASNNEVSITTIDEHGYVKGDSVYFFDVPVGSYNESFFVVKSAITLTRFIVKVYDSGAEDPFAVHITFSGTNSTSLVVHTNHGLLTGAKIQFRRFNSGFNWPTGIGSYEVGSASFAYVRNPTTNNYEIWTAPTGGSRITWANLEGGAAVNTFNVDIYPINGRAQFASARTGISNNYKVTAVASDLTESLPSVAVTSLNNLYMTGARNTITWDAVTGATRYNVYKEQSGLYGYIGQTATTSFVDDNIAPDMGTTPPIYDDVFSSTSNYPGAVTYFEQRRSLAGTLNQPQAIWMTKSATERDMSYSLPTRDNDRIFFQVAARESNTIRHLVPMAEMIALTNSAEWRVTSVNQDALTPYSISVRPQSYVGASTVQPVTINNVCVYAAGRGGHVRELGYNWQSSGYVTGDLSLRASHLFDDYEIVQMAYQKSPSSIIWMVSTSGKLLSFAYVPEEQVGAWHQHTTQGIFESCCVVSEGEEDHLYVVVNRGTVAAPVRYVERMVSQKFATLADAYFVDAGITFSSITAVTSIGGLDHLNGKTVAILADGKVHPTRVVSGGSVTLAYPVYKASIGLAYTSDLKTLPMVVQMEAFGQATAKNVSKVAFRVYQSAGFVVGPTSTTLTKTDPYATTPSLQSGNVDVLIHPTWDWDGSVLIRQSDPLPLNVLSMTTEVSIGGS